MTALKPCSYCTSARISFKVKKGRVGMLRASFYRETIKCPKCNIELSAGTPGNAVAFWNRSFEGLAP